MRVEWDKTGDRFYETGVDRGMLYLADSSGVYNNGVAWNGLTGVTESPSGAEASPQYADNIKYLNLVSAEEFGATIEAFTYPDQFEQCDGSAEIVKGVKIGQQPRKSFAFSYRTKIGNDTDGQDHGYKIHTIYGCLAAPSERAYQTINDSPEAIAFSWEITTTPINVPGYSPTATVTVDSRYTPADKMKELEDILYGTEDNEPRLPLPAEIAAIIGVVDEP